MSIVKRCIRNLSPWCAIVVIAACAPEDTSVDQDPVSAGDDDDSPRQRSDAGQDASKNAGKDAGKDASRRDAGRDAGSADDDATDDDDTADADAERGDHDAEVREPNGDAGHADAATPSEPKTDCIAPYISAVQTPLRLCRTCHVKGGAAEDARFLLTTDPKNDEQKLTEAYASLGRDLLAVPALENGHTHSGGKRFSKGSADYTAWSALLDALADPAAACTKAP
ncbi:MAG TPA: hypothetical protein VI299_09670 [Polyangiales bacterium]